MRGIRSHFGHDDPDFTWERLDEADALRKAAHEALEEGAEAENAAASGAAVVARQRPLRHFAAAVAASQV